MWSPKRQEGDTKIIGPAYTVKYDLKIHQPEQPPNHYVSISEIHTSSFDHDTAFDRCMFLLLEEYGYES